MRTITRIMIVALGIGLWSAGSTPAAEPAPKMSLAEAVKMLKDENALKEQAGREKVALALTALSEGEKQQLLAELIPMLTNLPSGYRTEPVYNAFLAAGPAALPPLVNALADDRQAPAAVNILSRFKTNAVEALTPALKHRDAKVQQRALAVLADGRVAGALAAPPGMLIEKISDPDVMVQREALRTLVVYGPKAMGAREALLKIAGQSPDISARIFAVRALGGLGAEAAPAVTQLTALINHPSLSLRAETLEVLGKLGVTASNAVPAVNARLLDASEDPYIRRLAAETLARLGPAGIAALASSLDAADDLVAYRAALGLASGDSAASIPAALDVLQGQNARARRFAALALAKLGPKAGEAYDRLASAASAAEMPVRRNAIEALGRLGNSNAVNICAAALKDPAPEVARAAAGAIETLVKDPERSDALLAEYRAAVAWRPSREPEKNLGLPAEELKKYEIGGPLAGLRLPLFKGQYGEEPGYPGCIPELMQGGKNFTDMNNAYNEWGPQGVAPEVELYPGAVEHYRNYMFKYYAARSFFDRQSQLKNWVAPDLPGAGKGLLGEYAEPVYHVPRHAPPQATGKFGKPVPVVRCGIRKPVFKLDLGELDAGLYAVRVIGAVENKNPRRFLEPLFLRFSVNDGPKGEVASYRIRCGYVDQFYSIAEFYFHALEKRRYTAELCVDDGSKVELLVHNLTLDDALAGTLRQPVKRPG